MSGGSHNYIANEINEALFGDRFEKPYRKSLPKCL